MSHTRDMLERGKKVMIGNYARQPVVMERGQGSHVWDSDGRKYLDLFAGFGGGILGHCHPELVAAAPAQANKLWHVGNTFYNQPQIEPAQPPNPTALEGKAFYCHHGLAANTPAAKPARPRGPAK